MYITRLTLINYRNYSRLALDLPAQPILLRGDNAHGKTNLLEAIAFLSTTRSTHARTDQQLINWLVLQQDVLPYTRVEAVVKTAHDSFELAITIVREGSSIRKDIQLNGVRKRAMDVIGRLTTVLFLPEDIELVTGSPSVRRRYLDSTLCQINPTYCRALSRYNRVLTQRNALLKDLFRRHGKPNIEQLRYWDEKLAEHGTLLTITRHEMLLKLDTLAWQHHHTLSDGREGLRLCYLPSFDLYRQPEPDAHLPLVAESLAPYTANLPPQAEVQAMFLADLQARHQEEIRRGMTTIGPHRDDFLFLADGVDLTMYGSRGQQRTAALSAKLGEVNLMKQATSEMPVLLLDDVMSELDIHRRRQILGLVEQAGQAMLTTTDWNNFEREFRRRAKLFNVVSGRLTPTTVDET